MNYKRVTFKKFIFTIASCVCLMVVMLNCVEAISEENSQQLINTSYYDAYYDRSYAISNGYILTVESGYSEDYLWYPDTFTIKSQNINKKDEFEIASFSSSWVRVFSNDRCFYIVESDYLNRSSNEPIRISIGKVDPQKLTLTWLDSYSFSKSSIQQENRAKDILLADHELLFIYDHKIKSYNVESRIIRQVYISDTGIINKSEENHASIYKGKLYIQKEDLGIYEIDLRTFEEIKLVTAGVLKRDINHRYTALYNYFLANDMLYCNVESYYKNETVSISLSNGEINTFLESPITFFAISSNGAYFDIYDGGGSRFFLNFSDSKITPILFNEFDIKEVLQNW